MRALAIAGLLPCLIPMLVTGAIITAWQTRLGTKPPPMTVYPQP